MRAIAALAAVFGTIAMPAISQTWRPDPFFGRWSLVSAESLYARESPPQEMTVVIEPDPEGIAYRSETHFAGGRTAASRFVARLDNTPTVVVGTSGFLAPVALVPANDGGIDAVYTSGFKKLAWSHWSVSTQGTELRIATTYLGANGEEYRNIAAFHRVDSH